MAADRRGAGALGAALVVCAVMGPARASTPLEDDASRLAAAYETRSDVRVERLAPRFIERSRPIALPAANAPAATGGGPACTTVVLLAPRTAELRAVLEDAGGSAKLPVGEDDEEEAESGGAGDAGDVVLSQAGVIVFSDCREKRAGDARAETESSRILVDTTSQRTAMEVLVIRSDSPVAAPSALLPERAVGPLAPRGDPGRTPELEPVDARIRRAEKNHRAQGAERVAHVAMRASDVGHGMFSVRLSAGCHAIDVLADTSRTMAWRTTDVDASARTAEGDRLLARDRGESPDARLRLCVGESTEVEVDFEGALGGVDVTLIDAVWPIAATLPSEWGPRALGELAASFRRHQTQIPGEAPMSTTLGTQGETWIPIAVEPGHCYVAATARIRGDDVALRLSAEIEDRQSDDVSAGNAEAALVAFCARVEEHAALRVDARGADAWWVTTVWRVTK